MMCHPQELQITLLTEMLGAIGIYWGSSRIRRRRGGSVDDTTDAMRAVACIRFNRRWCSLEFDFAKAFGTEETQDDIKNKNQHEQ
jgi:hypothetical protein